MRLTTLFCLLALAGCTATPPYPPVPAPLTEVIPLPPVTGEQLVWQPGHWDWNGSAYTWLVGLYVPAFGHGPNWVREYWALVNGQWLWQPAHWSN